MRSKNKLAVVVVGTGYVGLTTGLALAHLGHSVKCVDKNIEIVERLKRGLPTIFEAGLEELLHEAGRDILFTSDLAGSLDAADIVMIAVGTPAKANGDTDLRYVEGVAREIGEVLASGKQLVVVNKSTVPVGTARRVETVIEEELGERGVECAISVASNPEFLREGTALHDTFFPDRIVIGADDLHAVNLLRQMYTPILEQSFLPPRYIRRPEGYALPVLITTSPTSAELTKYAANAFLATKVSFINEFSGLAEKVGADISEVARGIGLDKRIGTSFLKAGVGWGGSCFPKDTLSILCTGRQYGYEMPLVEAAVEVNRRQRKKIIQKLQQTIKVIRGSTIGLLGLSFKPNTDDIRESPAISVIGELLEMGAAVKVYDPVAMENYKKSFPAHDVFYASSIEEAACHADALVLLTEWEEFLHLPWPALGERMRGRVLIDGRNALPEDELKAAGFAYLGMGRS